MRPIRGFKEKVRAMPQRGRVGKLPLWRRTLYRLVGGDTEMRHVKAKTVMTMEARVYRAARGLPREDPNAWEDLGVISRGEF